VICDFCGYLAQVKTSEKADVETIPPRLLGAAWGPQRERMDAGIYFPLFIVLVTKNRRQKAIYYLPADLQAPELFEPRKPLSTKARRAGWTGFMIRLDRVVGSEPVRIAYAVHAENGIARDVNTVCRQERFLDPISEPSFVIVESELLANF
jgi:type II restriction enzyme